MAQLPFMTAFLTDSTSLSRRMHMRGDIRVPIDACMKLDFDSDLKKPSYDISLLPGSADTQSLVLFDVVGHDTRLRSSWGKLRLVDRRVSRYDVREQQPRGHRGDVQCGSHLGLSWTKGTRSLQGKDTADRR